MSGISVDRFVSVAREKESGEVRFGRAKEGEVPTLVNKGTFGQRVLTWAKDPSGTVPQRQEAAIDAFRNALSREYGASLADKAMAGAGITPGQAMTGAQILDAVTRAKADKAQNIQQNLQYRREYFAMPPGSAREGTTGFDRFRPALRDELSGHAACDFQDEFPKDLAKASEDGRKPLSPAEVEIIAHSRMCAVLERHDKPDTAERVRSEYRFHYQAEGAGAGAGAGAGVAPRMEGPVLRPEVMVPQVEGEAPRAEGAPPQVEGAPPRAGGEPIRAQRTLD